MAARRRKRITLRKRTKADRSNERFARTRRIWKKRRRTPVRTDAIIPGIPADVSRRLLDLDDEYHLEPEGRDWLRQAVDALDLLNPARGRSLLRRPRRRWAAG